MVKKFLVFKKVRLNLDGLKRSEDWLVSLILEVSLNELIEQVLFFKFAFPKRSFPEFAEENVFNRSAFVHPFFSSTEAGHEWDLMKQLNEGCSKVANDDSKWESSLRQAGNWLRFFLSNLDANTVLRLFECQSSWANWDNALVETDDWSDFKVTKPNDVLFEFWSERKKRKQKDQDLFNVFFKK